MVLAPGIALAHGRPEDGMSKISLYSEIVLSMHSEMRKLSETLFDLVGVVEAQINGIKKVIRDYVEVTHPV